MARTLTAAMTASVSSPTGSICHLMKFEFSSGDLNITTAGADITYNGDTYIAVGGHASLDVLSESINPRAPSVRVTLDGVDTSVLALMLGATYIGRNATIWRAYLDTSTYAIIDDPLKFGPLYMLNSFEYEETHDEIPTARITTTLISRLVISNMIKGLQPTLHAHQQLYSTDTFFAFVKGLANRTFHWGGERVVLHKPELGPNPAVQTWTPSTPMPPAEGRGL